MQWFDIREGKVSHLRENIPLESFHNVAGIALGPSRSLVLMPLQFKFLEGVRSSYRFLHSLSLAFLPWVLALGYKLASLGRQLSGLCKCHSVEGAQRNVGLFAI